MKILNLYAGIGGNRKLWDGHDITAVEINPKIAKIYQDLFPNDKVIVGDAHEYLRRYFRDYDFIWSSPPCPTHSILQMTRKNSGALKYPDMTLYQEILLLQNFFGGGWVVENVQPFYKPLIPPTFVMERHCYWSNKFVLGAGHSDGSYSKIRDDSRKMAEKYGYTIDAFTKQIDVRKALRNAVKPEDGKFILEQFINE